MLGMGQSTTAGVVLWGLVTPADPGACFCLYLLGLLSTPRRLLREEPTGNQVDTCYSRRGPGHAPQDLSSWGTAEDGSCALSSRTWRPGHLSCGGRSDR